MLILAIDTSGQSGGITLAEADTGSFRVIESAAIAGGTFSAQLIPTLAALLKKHGHRAADIGGLSESGAAALAGFAGAMNVNSYGGVTCKLGNSILLCAYVTGPDSSFARNRNDELVACCGTTRAVQVPAAG